VPREEATAVEDPQGQEAVNDVAPREANIVVGAGPWDSAGGDGSDTKKTGNAQMRNTSNAFTQTQNPNLLLVARRLMAAYRKVRQQAALRMTDAPRRGVQREL
jgi:hypothetical protein